MGFEVFKKLLFVFVFATIAAFYFIDLSDHPMHEDEYVWVNRGAIHFKKFFIDRDFSSDFWQSYYSYDQPKLGEFIYGAYNYFYYRNYNFNSLFIETGFSDKGVEEATAWSPDAWWVLYQAKSPQSSYIPYEKQVAYRIIVSNRYLGVLFGLGVLGIIFVIGEVLGGFFMGLLSMLVLAQHGLFYGQSRHAMADMMLLFFMLMCFLPLFLYEKVSSEKESKRQFFLQIGLLVILGVFAGLAFAIKLNGFAGLFLSCLWVGFAYFKLVFTASSSKRSKKALHAVVALATLVLVSIGVFVSLNTFVWENPVSKTKAMFLWRRKVSFEMQKGFPDSSYNSFLQRIKAIIEETVLPVDGDQRVFSWLPSYTDTILVVLGLFLMGFKAFLGKKKNRAYLQIFLVWFLGTLVFMGSYLVVGFDRYFLPILPYLSVIETFGIVVLGQEIFKKLAGLISFRAKT
jgi:hypothetical protein